MQQRQGQHVGVSCVGCIYAIVYIHPFSRTAGWHLRPAVGFVCLGRVFHVPVELCQALSESWPQHCGWVVLPQHCGWYKQLVGCWCKPVLMQRQQRFIDRALTFDDSLTIVVTLVLDGIVLAPDIFPLCSWP